MGAGWFDPEARQRWTQEPLSEADPGFTLCDECGGAKLCGLEPHAYCRGWCHVCGGAGQWPLDPDTPWFAPSPPLIDVEAVARGRSAPPSPAPPPTGWFRRWLARWGWAR
ncbi:MAG: hypothetical protein ABMB14_08350 [Myxococcota bacterium]